MNNERFHVAHISEIRCQLESVDKLTCLLNSAKESERENTAESVFEIPLGKLMPRMRRETWI